jgi:hypothetical protein
MDENSLFERVTAAAEERQLSQNTLYRLPAHLATTVRMGGRGRPRLGNLAVGQGSSTRRPRAAEVLPITSRLKQPFHSSIASSAPQIRLPSVLRHPVEIRRRYGFRDFSDISARFRLNRWLYALCWTGTDRPGMLFDRAVAWLITNKVLLPGATVLERQVTRIRNRAQTAATFPCWTTFAKDLS